MQRDRVTSSSGCIHTERDSSETRDHGKRLRAGSIPAVECTSQCPVSIVGRRQRNPPASARGDVWVSGRIEQLASNGRQNISYIEIPRARLRFTICDDRSYRTVNRIPYIIIRCTGTASDSHRPAKQKYDLSTVLTEETVVSTTRTARPPPPRTTVIS